MARRKYSVDEALIARYLKEGRGTGLGADYKPWLRIYDVPSLGRSHRLRGIKTGRVHHFLSDIEVSLFYLLDWHDAVLDIREQFPLDREETQAIAERAGIRYPVDSHIFRVLWVDPLGRGYYVINVHSQSAFPEFRGAQELEELIVHNEAALFPDDQWLAPLVDAGLPDSHKERRDRAWELIQPLALNVPGIFKPRVRGEAVAALVDAGKATKQTVYRLLRRYWQRGMVPNALLPDYTRSGARGREKIISPERRRSGAEGNTYSVVIDADVRQLDLP